MPQPDEHMTLPTWRWRQLRDVEDAAREVRELIAQTPRTERIRRADLVDEIKALLDDAVVDE